MSLPLSKKLLLPLFLATAALLPAQLLVQKPVIILIGPPGSGKSTQAQRLAAKLGAPIVSPESMIAANKAIFEAARNPSLREMDPREDPALNRLFGATVQGGGFPKGMILDGYPATKDHGDYLAKQATQGVLPPPIVVQLHISDDDVRKRLKSDPPAQLEQRLKDYHREMDMIRLYFPNVDITQVDAAKKEDQVAQSVWKLVSAKLEKK